MRPGINDVRSLVRGRHDLRFVADPMNFPPQRPTPELAVVTIDGRNPGVADNQFCR